MLRGQKENTSTTEATRQEVIKLFQILIDVDDTAMLENMFEY